MKACLTLQQCLAIKTTKIVGIAADHGGHELKEYLATLLREAGAEVIDFGGRKLVPEDDYPDFVVPLARAVAAGQVERGVALCGSGVGACVASSGTAKPNGHRQDSTPDARTSSDRARRGGSARVGTAAL